MTVALLVNHLFIIALILYTGWISAHKGNRYFGVLVPDDWPRSEEGRAEIGRFRSLMSMGALASLICLGIGWVRPGAYQLMVGVMIQIALLVFGLVGGWRRTLPFSAAPQGGVRIADLFEQRPSTARLLIPVFISFAILIGVSFYLSAKWESIPEKFPTHWGASGQADGWATKTPKTVFRPVAIGASVMFLIAVLSYITCTGARVNTKRSRKMISATANLFAVVSIAVSILLGYISVAPLIGGMSLWVGALIPVSIIATMIPLLSASQMPEEAGADPAMSASADDKWWMGSFYFNADDPAVVVEKRLGIGYSYNFAQPLSWMLVLAGFLPVLVGFVLS